MSIRYTIFFISVTIFIITLSTEVRAQSEPDPRGAFLRSLVLPGWGHYYTNNQNWRRGAVHLGTDLVLIATYAGLGARASNLMDQYTTLASLRAGINISERNRSFQLAMADFNTLKEYNDYQLRSRNWNQLIDDVPENQWNWASEKDRNRYNELRSNRESVKNQMPAIAALMVLNRVLSAVNAYSRAREISAVPEVAVMPVPVSGETGLVAMFRFRY